MAHPKMEVLAHLSNAMSGFLSAKRGGATKAQAREAVALLRTVNPEIVAFAHEVTCPDPLERLDLAPALEQARQIAWLAHDGQTAKYGPPVPYIQHVMRVVANVDTDEARIVAWLHDVVEDNPAWSFDRLAHHGIPSHLVVAVAVLTRFKDVPYDEYIRHIVASGNHTAVQVKIADINDHLLFMDPSAEHLRVRYTRALVALMSV
jgi:(p)ppGpp synthase/HD superfamily hydrolase